MHVSGAEIIEEILETYFDFEKYRQGLKIIFITQFL